MTWQLWSAFVLVDMVLRLTPGPAVLFVLGQALSRGTARTLWSIGGIVVANAAYFVLSATGVGAILMTSYQLFFAIKWIGAAYLVWLGLRALFGRAHALSVRAADPRPAPAGRLFLNGFILQMSNPKMLIFVTALVPQFINPHAPIWPQIAILAATAMVTEFTVQLGYAAMAGRAAHLAAEPRFARWTDRVSGSLLIGAGVGLAALRER